MTKIPSPDKVIEAEALARQNQLTKPPGSLGQLEDVAVRLAALQRRERPRLSQVRIAVFAGDHGVVADGVSAFPQSVTVEMIRNFARGGAAIGVLSRELGADLEVINVGSVTEVEPLSDVREARVGPGTANFRQGEAMTAEQFERAFREGVAAVERAADGGCDLFIGGEMGIGNTTAASAVACSLLGASARELAGPGTGLGANGVAHKCEVIESALERHGCHPDDADRALRTVGGFEIVALAGAYTAAAARGIPALVDGFITSVAALAAVQRNPDVKPWLLYSHTSAEPGHRRVLNALDADPMLNIGMRLGEASGAATVVPLLRLACALHNGMATFEEAGVSQ